MIIINSLSTFGHKTIITRPGAYWTKIQSQYDKNPKNTQKTKDVAHVLSVTWLSPFFKINI